MYLNFCLFASKLSPLHSKVTLKPGQLLHINKGRRCAVRVMPRLEVIKTGQICMGVFWNWMFLGKTCDGIKEEVSCVLKASNNPKSFGIPRLSLVALSEKCLLRYNQEERKSEFSICIDKKLLITHLILISSGHLLDRNE